MACSVCNGHPNCPCCSPEPNMIECPSCGGKGKYHYAYDYENDREVECTETAYQCLPENEDCARQLNQNYSKGSIVECDVCNGEGVIEYEYEPDYDDYD